MNDLICKNCKHYVQHYGLGEDRFYRIYAGHCIQTSPRNKRPDTKACIHFAPGVADDARFVNKKYLSKALLEYMCGLELLPELTEMEADGAAGSRTQEQSAQA